MMTTLTKGILAGAGCALFAANVQALSVTFGGFDDNDGFATGFDADATALAADGTFTMGDPSVSLALITQDFAVDTDPGGVDVFYDQLAFTMEAPAGWFITGIEFSETISYDATGSGFAAATASIDINGESSEAGSFGMTGSMGQNFFGTSGVVPIGNQTLVAISIDNNLFAANGAQLSKSDAQVGVTLAPVPVPPAVWMFGSAVAGLSVIGRRQARRAR